MNTPRSIVEKMFSAFAAADVEKFLETVSNDTVWIYHGTQVIPNGVFHGVAGARKFITNILNNTDIINFEPLQYICDGNTVAVIGREHQRVKRSGKEMKQKWVQIYTLENDLITKMEEFASSEVVN